jgi:hypothetical protein
MLTAGGTAIIIADIIIIGGGTTAGIITVIGSATALRKMLHQVYITPVGLIVDILCGPLCYAALLGVSGIHGRPNIR